MTRPTVVLLNGVGSAGKSTIARAFQKIASEPFLHVEMDGFLAMLPEAYQDHPEGVAFERLSGEGNPSVAVTTGPVAERALTGMRHAVAALAAQGNNLVIDEVIFGDVTTAHGNPVAEYRALLAPFRLCLVGVFAPLDVLEAREAGRGDRHIGLARWQYDRVHRGMAYDLEVDSGRASPEDCAQAIKRHFEL